MKFSGLTIYNSKYVIFKLQFLNAVLSHLQFLDK